jgi:hypothetical protein
MKKSITIIVLLLVVLVGLPAQQTDYRFDLGASLRAKINSYALTLDQALLTTSSPSFSNLTVAPTLSVEQITNFAGWTPTTNWTYAGGKWSHATGSATALTATGETAIVAGTKYEMIVTVTQSVAGSGFIVFLGGVPSTTINAAGTYTLNVTAVTTAAPYFAPQGSGTWVGDITAFSVKIKTNGRLTSEGITANSGQSFFNLGSIAYPSIASLQFPTTGISFYRDGSVTQFSNMGTNSFSTQNSGASIPSNTLALYFGASFDTILKWGAAATLQMGLSSATPIDQNILACGGVGVDKTGALLVLQGGQSTGTGIPGGVKLQTAYSGFASNSTAQTQYTREWKPGKVWSISDNSATGLISITCADGSMAAGYLIYSIEVTDGTDHQVESGTVTFAAVNKATETWTTDIDEESSQAASGGTLATTWACDTATADTLKITLNSNSSLTPTSTKIRLQIFLNSQQIIALL